MIEREGELFYTIHDAAKELGLSEATVRRRIKAGKMKADLITGSYGLEYRIPIESVYPSNVVLETKVLEVVQPISKEDIERLLSDVLAERENLLETKLDTLEMKVVEMSDKINTLLDVIDGMQKKEEKISWWRRVFGGGGK